MGGHHAGGAIHLKYVPSPLPTILIIYYPLYRLLSLFTTRSLLLLATG